MTNVKILLKFTHKLTNYPNNELWPIFSNLENVTWLSLHHYFCPVWAGGITSGGTSTTTTTSGGGTSICTSGTTDGITEGRITSGCTKQTRTSRQ